MKDYFASDTFRDYLRLTNERRAMEGLPAFEPKPHSPVWIDNCRPRALLRP
jgi:hypothetical protein